MASSSGSIQEEASATFDDIVGTHSNLRCFLDSVTPIVKAHRVLMAPYYLPQVSLSWANFYFCCWIPLLLSGTHDFFCQIFYSLSLYYLWSGYIASFVWSCIWFARAMRIKLNMWAYRFARGACFPLQDHALFTLHLAFMYINLWVCWCLRSVYKVQIQNALGAKHKFRVVSIAPLWGRHPTVTCAIIWIRRVMMKVLSYGGAVILIRSSFLVLP